MPPLSPRYLTPTVSYPSPTRMQDLHAVTLGDRWLVDPMHVLHPADRVIQVVHRYDQVGAATGQDMHIVHTGR